jgi:hypothetical protein
MALSLKSKFLTMPTIRLAWLARKAAAASLPRGATSTAVPMDFPIKESDNPDSELTVLKETAISRLSNTPPGPDGRQAKVVLETQS